ncbi:MAG TPA: CocE/NonD family hydrolase [Acidimicrobiales bacterium]|nr:CocE/NonD family hydrolase [Acidimicrobiales bacterium]
MTVWSRIAASMVRLPPPQTADVAVERDLAAKMPDGVVLLADRWYPADETGHAAPAGAHAGDAGSRPTVLIRTPYGRRVMGPLGRLYAERGYQTVIQSCRATFGSEGEWEPLRHEQADGHATLAWIAAQPWFDGRLVMWGGSYLGGTQWAIAEDAPDFVRALGLQVTSSNFRDAIVYPGGSFALEMAVAWLYQIKYQEEGWRTVLRTSLRGGKILAAACDVLPLGQCDTAAIGEPAAVYQNWLDHEAPGDPWWDPVDFGRRLDKVPPASLIGGWYDLFLPAQVADYEALRRAGREARLTIGPWTHSSPGLFAETVRDGPAWWEEHLGEHAGREPRAAVRVYVMGSRTWEEFSMWPPAGETQRWYLGRWGTLSTDAPAESAPDRYHYNPHDPTPAVGGATLNMGTSGRKEQRRREHRHDVLTYTSPVLREDLTAIGPLRATLYVRSSLEHTDFVVRLCDVTPKGKSYNVSDGIVRLRPGSVPDDEDGVRQLEIEMWPTANTFKAGHRIRLQVSSGAHPMFCRNTGTGEPLGTATELRSADQEVFHDAVRASSIELPVVRLIGREPLG